MLGDHDASISGFLKVAQPLPVFRQILASAYGSAGDEKKALSIVEELKETRAKSQFYVPSYFTAAIFVSLGDF